MEIERDFPEPKILDASGNLWETRPDTVIRRELVKLGLPEREYFQILSYIQEREWGMIEEHMRKRKFGEADDRKRAQKILEEAARARKEL